MIDRQHVGALKSEVCELCDRILAAGHKNMAVIQACKRCGLPVDEAEASQAQYLEMAGSVKREFFPHNT